MSKWKPRKLQYYKPNVRCHICCLPISNLIINPHDPLAGSIDHVRPIALGGSDSARNRKPAHRGCNQLRGTLEITPEVRWRCFLQMLDRYNGRSHAIVPSLKDRKHARVLLERITGVWVCGHRMLTLEDKIAHQLAMANWADDGGSIAPLQVRYHKNKSGIRRTKGDQLDNNDNNPC